MPFAARARLTFAVACVLVAVVSPSLADTSPTTDQALSSSAVSLSSSAVPLSSSAVPLSSTTSPSSRDEVLVPDPTAPTVGQVIEYVAKDTPLANTNKDHAHGPKPIKIKKKKPMGKHKKKKQSFKDKLMPLLLIPFVIQTMLIPMFIMNLSLLAMKAMAVGKFAIVLIVINMIRSWSQNAHSTSIRGGSRDSLMAQNYGFNGGAEFGSFFNGR